MKRLLLIPLLALALFVGVAGAAPATHAAGVCLADIEDNLCHDADDLVCTCTAPASPSATAAATNASKIPANPNLSGDPGSQFSTVMNWIMTLFAWLVGAAAITLDWAVQITVVKMGSYVSGLTAIGVTWRILRDIGNIVLIFGFIAIGISVILDTERIGYKAKMLPMLLIVAVFINFSLFISEAVIDTGNLFATQFYTQINGGSIPDLSTVNPNNEGISNKIMAQLGLSSIYGDAQRNQKLYQDNNSWLVAFMGILLFLVAAFVMFSLAFILIARFVVLVFLIIIAPIGFAGLVVPKLEHTASEWWSQLFRQTITAPVLLLLLYVALAIITDASFLTGTCGAAAATCTKSWTGFVEGGDLSGFGSLMISFLLAMGLLLTVVAMAGKIGAKGADWATKFAGSLSFGAGAWIGRGTLGMAGVGLSNKRMQRMAKRKGAGGLALKTLVLGGKGLANRTYDFRNNPAVGAGLHALGISAGHASELTAKEIHAEKYGGKPIKEWLHHSQQEREEAARYLDNEKNLKTAVDTKDDNLAQATLSRMSNKEIEELDGIKHGVETLVKNLSPEQFEALMKSDKFTEADKVHMRDNRYASLQAALDPHTALTAAQVRTEVRQWTSKDLAYAVPNVLNDPAQMRTLTSNMSESQYEAMTKNDRLTRSQQKQFKDFSKQGIIESLHEIRSGGTPSPILVASGVIPAGMSVPAATAEMVTRMKQMSPKNFAKLPPTILTNPATLNMLAPKQLTALMSANELSDGDIHTIALAIRNPRHPNAADFATYLRDSTADAYWQ